MDYYKYYKFFEKNYNFFEENYKLFIPMIVAIILFFIILVNTISIIISTLIYVNEDEDIEKKKDERSFGFVPITFFVISIFLLIILSDMLKSL
jgi:hypothetical protein